jgi:hypothetical protein
MAGVAGGTQTKTPGREPKTNQNAGRTGKGTPNQKHPGGTNQKPKPGGREKQHPSGKHPHCTLTNPPRRPPPACPLRKRDKQAAPYPAQPGRQAHGATAASGGKERKPTTWAATLRNAHSPAPTPTDCHLNAMTTGCPVPGSPRPTDKRGDHTQAEGRKRQCNRGNSNRAGIERNAPRETAPSNSTCTMR